MALLYQEIMNVPGLSGTWQQRNRQLYEKMGSPLGRYTGSYAQNIMLLNSIHSNNYYRDGLPGETSGGSGATSTHTGNIIDDSMGGVNTRPGDINYSEDVVSPDEWNWLFDEWTRNFAANYMEPEWTNNVLNPTMKQLHKGIGDYEKQMANSGAWRSTMSQKNLAQMSDDAIKEKDAMQREFQGSVLEVRDAMRQNLASPLYESNMKRYYDAPWAGHVGEEGLPEGLEDIPGVSGENLNDLISSINSRDPSTITWEDLPPINWDFEPNTPYSNNILSDYYTGGY